MNFEKAETDTGMMLMRPGEEMLVGRRWVTVVEEIYVNPCEKCLAEEKKPERLVAMACGIAHGWASAEVIHPFQGMLHFDDPHWENPLPWFCHCSEASVAQMPWYC